MNIVVQKFFKVIVISSWNPVKIWIMCRPVKQGVK